MSILKRIKRIALGNIKQLLDDSYAPETELQETIRELEVTAAEAREALAGFAATHKRLELERDQLALQGAELQKRAENSIRAGEDEPAKRALGERLKIAERIKQIAQRLAKSAAMYKELKESLVSLHDRLNAAQLKQADLETRKRVAQAEKKFKANMDRMTAATSTEKVFNRFEREVFQAEAAADLDNQLRAELTSVDVKVEKLAMEGRLDEEFEKLKKKLSK